MPIEISKTVIERDENIVAATLDTLARDRQYRRAISIKGISNLLNMTGVKPALKKLMIGREQQVKDIIGRNPYLMEAYGSRDTYNFAFQVLLANMVGFDGTPFNYAMTGVFVQLNQFMDGYYLNKGDRGLPIEKARPSYDFLRFGRKNLQEMMELGTVDFVEGGDNGGTIIRENVDPETMWSKFWGKRLHLSKSGFIRDVSSMKADRDAPEERLMFDLLRDYHNGREYGLTRRRVNDWLLLTKDLARFVWTDKQFLLHLSYGKVRWDLPIWMG